MKFEKKRRKTIAGPYIVYYGRFTFTARTRCPCPATPRHDNIPLRRSGPAAVSHLARNTHRYIAPTHPIGCNVPLLFVPVSRLEYSRSETQTSLRVHRFLHTDRNQSSGRFMCGCVEPRNQYRLKIPFRVVCVQVFSVEAVALMNPNPHVGGWNATRARDEWPGTMDFIFISIKREANSSAAVNGIRCVVFRSSSIPQHDLLPAPTSPPNRFEKCSTDCSTRLKCIVRTSCVPYVQTQILVCVVFIIILLLTSSMYHIYLHPVYICVLPAGMFKWG